MAAQEKYALNWNKFETAAMDTIKSLYHERNFTNVTLVCEEDQQVEAHKVILSSASPFFKNILLKKPHPHPLIYLKGLKIDELWAIVDFIYLGKTEVESVNIESFLQVANDLEVKGLQTRQEIGETPDGLVKMMSSNDKEEKSVVEAEETNEHLDSEFSGVPNLFLMEQSYGSLNGLTQPVEQATDRKYPCADCEYKANRPDHLRRHKLKIHSGLVGHELNESKLSLNTEIKIEMDTSDSDILKSGSSIFEDLTKRRFPCDECDYKAGRADHLRRHKNKVHDVANSFTNQSTKTFNCDNCDFTSVRSDNLKRHVEKKHQSANI